MILLFFCKIKKKFFSSDLFPPLSKFGVFKTICHFVAKSRNIKMHVTKNWKIVEYFSSIQQKSKMFLEDPVPPILFYSRLFPPLSKFVVFKTICNFECFKIIEILFIFEFYSSKFKNVPRDPHPSLIVWKKIINKL